MIRNKPEYFANKYSQTLQKLGHIAKFYHYYYDLFISDSSSRCHPHIFSPSSSSSSPLSSFIFVAVILFPVFLHYIHRQDLQNHLQKHRSHQYIQVVFHLESSIHQVRGKFWNVYKSHIFLQKLQMYRNFSVRSNPRCRDPL